MPPRTLIVLLVSAQLAVAAPDWKSVESILAAKCYSCHGGEKTKGEVDLKALASDPKVAAEYQLWTKVKDSIENGDMPPPKAKPLEDSEANHITDWISSALQTLADAQAGDPGPVTMRRLTNAEYSNTLRDLTGQDYGLAAEFQADGGGGEGFTNTGDVLFVSPAALSKYLSAARKVADHATILPGTGVAFHAQRIGLRGPEQVKAQAQQGLYVWYQQKSGPHLPKDTDDLRADDYMLACWKHLHQKTPLNDLARDAGLNPHFLHNWFRLVTQPEPKSRYLDLVRASWRELPTDEKQARQRIAQIEADLLSWNNPKNPGSGVQRRQQDSDGIRPYSVGVQTEGKKEAYLAVGDLGDGNKGDIALVTSMEVMVKGKKLNYHDWLAQQQAPECQSLLARYGKHPQPGRHIEPNVLTVTAPTVLTLPLPPQTSRITATLKLDMANPEVDAATMQWTLTSSQPRDPTKIMAGVLTIWKRSTEASRRTMGDFNVMKSAFPDMFERRLEEVADNLYRTKPGIGVYYYSDEQLGLLLGEQDRKKLAAMKQDWAFCAPTKLNPQQAKENDQLMCGHLHNFVSRAWRRPLTSEEKAKLDNLYANALGKELDRESAAREVIVQAMISPHFLFKAETLPTSAPSGGISPLTAHELASRLSYFLWASLPDWELRKTADDGSLLTPEVMTAQTQRMLQSPKSRALAEEFAGQWFRFQGFDAQSTVDVKKFPEFTPELKKDMLREVTEFFAQMVKQDHPITDAISGDFSYLNERLARFYGIPGVSGSEFRRVVVRNDGRGGILGMGALLTKTSRPHRTSPVLRGDFLYQVVLGFSSPPPPPNVPELKDDGSKPASLREALMKHRQDAACSVCHDRIDPLGFALEGFDPIGRLREADTRAELKDGTKFEGIAGLRDYLKKNQGPFIQQFCRKLLGYGLGRQVLLSDKALLRSMQEALQSNGQKFSTAVQKIVHSTQFQSRRTE
jgi:cytochrome c553